MRTSYQRDMSNYPDHTTSHMYYIVYGKRRSHLYLVLSHKICQIDPTGFCAEISDQGSLHIKMISAKSSYAGFRCDGPLRIVCFS